MMMCYTEAFPCNELYFSENYGVDTDEEIGTYLIHRVQLRELDDVLLSCREYASHFNVCGYKLYLSDASTVQTECMYVFCHK